MTILTTRPLLTRFTGVLLALLPLVSACKKETDLQKQAREHEEKYKVIDDNLIKDYFSRNNITSSKFTQLPSGIYLVDADTVANGTGEDLKPGQVVQVKYIGKFITATRENVVFDKSYGNRTLCECYEVTIDQSSVIKGWHEALKNMKLGSHKRVFIPSYMAYGPAGSSSIGPDEPLQFDMRVTKVK